MTNLDGRRFCGARIHAAPSPPWREFAAVCRVFEGNRLGFQDTPLLFLVLRVPPVVLLAWVVAVRYALRPGKDLGCLVRW